MNDEVDAVRQVARRWADAVEHADVAALAILMADDIVVIHGDGRCLSGRDAVVADFARAFDVVRTQQQIDFDETIVAGEWAFDRATVQTRITRRESGASRQIRSRTLTVLRRAASGGWVVARAIGVVEQA